MATDSDDDDDVGGEPLRRHPGDPPPLCAHDLMALGEVSAALTLSASSRAARTEGGGWGIRRPEAAGANGDDRPVCDDGDEF